MNLLRDIFNLLPSGFLGGDSPYFKNLITEKKYFIDGDLFDLSTDWPLVEKKPRSIQRQLHMNSFVGDLLPTLESCEKQQVELACDLVESWKSAFTYVPNSKNMEYHDETTARRILFWLRIYLISSANGYNECLDRIKKILDYDIEVLISEDFYAGMNNHGMFQSLTIIYCCLLEFVHKDIGVLHAKKLLKYLNFSVSTDGVHLEHSPIYHFIVAGQYYKNIRFINIISPGDAEIILTVLDRMKLYAHDLIMPTGEIPPIGDTSQVIPANYYRDMFEIKDGDYPLREWVVYEGGGYAIFKSNILEYAKSSYCFFAACHHNSYHKHSDDLSLLVYKNGWILSESGPFGYDYKNKHSIHAYSNLGHNSIIFDKNLLLDRNIGIGCVVIKEKYQTNESYCVIGHSERVAGRQHTRKVEFFKDGSLINITDKVETLDGVPFALTWHTPLMPIVKSVDDNVLVYLEDKAFFSFKNLNANTTIRYSYGDEDDFYHSFSYPQMGVVEKTYVIIIEGYGNLNKISYSLNLMEGFHNV